MMQRPPRSTRTDDRFPSTTLVRSIDAAHDTEINSGDVPVWRDEQIALVHVGMEESIRNRLTQESVHQTGSNGGHVMHSRDQSLTVGNLDAVNPFERQHAPGGTVPVNGGNDIQSEERRVGEE